MRARADHGRDRRALWRTLTIVTDDNSAPEKPERRSARRSPPPSLRAIEIGDRAAGHPRWRFVMLLGGDAPDRRQGSRNGADRRLSRSLPFSDADEARAALKEAQRRALWSPRGAERSAQRRSEQARRLPRVSPAFRLTAGRSRPAIFSSPSAAMRMTVTITSPALSKPARPRPSWRASERVDARCFRSGDRCRGHPPEGDGEAFGVAARRRLEGEDRRGDRVGRQDHGQGDAARNADSLPGDGCFQRLLTTITGACR